MTHPLTPREKVADDLLFFKLKDLITEQSEGEWDDAMIARDAHHFANHLRPLFDRRTALASSGDHAELARRPVAWRWRYKGTNWIFGADRPSWPEDEDEVVEPLFSEATLAENAALRAENTEAERKLAEAEDENTRWLFRMADIREASGIGVKPMLDEVPGELRAMRERLAEAVLVLTGIAKGEVPPEQHGHYLAHRQAVKAARTFLSKEAERG